jgi:hypothetical protein
VSVSESVGVVPTMALVSHWLDGMLGSNFGGSAASPVAWMVAAAARRREDAGD